MALIKWNKEYVALYKRRLELEQIKLMADMEANANTNMNASASANDATDGGAAAGEASSAARAAAEAADLDSKRSTEASSISLELSVLEVNAGASEVAAARARAHAEFDVELARLESAREAALAHQRRQQNRWFGWVRGGGGAGAANHQSSHGHGEGGGTAGLSLSNEERAELLKAIDFDEEALVVVADDCALWYIDLALNRAKLALVDYHDHVPPNSSAANLCCKPLVKMTFHSSGVMSRRPHSWDCTASVGAFEVFDARPVTAFPKLVTAARKKAGGGGGGPEVLEVAMLRVGNETVSQSMTITVSSNPLLRKPATPGSNDTYFRAKVHPFEVVYSTDCVSAIRRVLGSNSPHRPSSRSYDTHVGAYEPDADQGVRKWKTTMSRVSAWRDRQARLLLSKLGQRDGVKGALSIEVDWDAPFVVLPETSTSSSSPIMVCDLGHFSFTSLKMDGPTDNTATAGSTAGLTPVNSDNSVAVEDIDLDDPAASAPLPTILAMSPSDGGYGDGDGDRSVLTRGTVLSRSLTVNSTEDFDGECLPPTIPLPSQPHPTSIPPPPNPTLPYHDATNARLLRRRGWRYAGRGGL